MKKVIVGLLVFVGLARGQATVTITDPLKRPDGVGFSGSVTIMLKYAGPLSTSSYTLTAGLKRVQVINGSFSVSLTPNSAITPAGTSYAVRYSPSDGSPGWDEIWVVPSSPTTTTVRAVRGSTAPTPTVMFTPQQLSAVGASPGQAIIYNGSAITWGSVAAGSVAWGSVTGTPSLQADLAPYVRTLLSAASPITYNSLSGLISCPTCGAGGGGGTWGSITGTLSAQLDLASALAGKSDTSHGHVIGDVTSLQGSLDAKASATHQHNGGDITSGYVGPAYLGSGTRTGAKFLRDDGTWQNASGGVATVFGRAGDVVAVETDYATFYAALSHVHLIADVTGLQTALDGKSGTSHLHAGVYEPVDAAILRSSGSYVNPAWLSSITWAKITGAPSTYAPTAHAPAHLAAGGDPLALTVSEIVAGSRTGSGNRVVTAAGVPANGCTYWDSGDLKSMGSACGGGGTITSVGYAEQAMTSATSVTVTHNFNSLLQTYRCRNGSGVVVEPDSVTAGLTSTVFTFTTAETGACGVFGGTGLYSGAFTTQTSVAFAHNFNTSSIDVRCYNASNQAVEPNTVTATDSNTATVSFTAAQPGYCAVNARLALGGGAGGGVSSVALSAPAEFSVSGSPITGSGTLGFSWASQTAARFLAAPAATPGSPSFRAIAASDLPAMVGDSGSGGVKGACPAPAAGDAAAGKFLNAGGTYTVPPGGGGGTTYTAGDGIDAAQLAAGVAAVDTTVPAVAAQGSQSLTFGTINASSCSVQTITATGATLGDKPIPGWPATLPDGVLGMMIVSATNTLQVRLCKLTTGAADVTGLTFTYQIVRAR